MSFYTPLISTDDVNHTNLNAHLTEISNAIDGVLDGSEAQPSPDILDFTLAGHDHVDAAGGGQLTMDALKTGITPEGRIITADGDGGADLVAVVPYTFKLLADTPNSLAGLGSRPLRVNLAEDGVDTLFYASVEHTAYTIAIYTTTSTTFVDVDIDNFSLDIDTEGEDLLIGFGCNCFNVSENDFVYFDLDVDGGRVGGDDGIIAQEFKHPRVLPVFFTRLIPLAAGSHTIKLQWKVSASIGTLYSSTTTGTNLKVHPQLFAMKKVGL